MSLVQITLASLPTVVATATTVVNVRLKQAARAEGRERAEHLRLLLAATTAGNRSASFSAAAKSVLDDVARVSPWQVSHVYVCGEGDGELSSTSVWRVPTGPGFDRLVAATAGATLCSDSGASGRALSSRRPASVPDLTTEAHVPRYRAAQRAGLKSALAIPVLCGYDVVAVIEFFSEQSGTPDPASLDVLVNVCDQLGRRLERQWADEDLDERDEEVVRLTASLRNAEQQLDQSEAKLRRSKRQLTNAKKQQREAEGQARRSGERVRESGDRIAGLEERVRQSNERLRDLEEQLREMNDQRRELIVELRRADERRQELEVRLTQADDRPAPSEDSGREDDEVAPDMGLVLPLAVAAVPTDGPSLTATGAFDMSSVPSELAG